MKHQKYAFPAITAFFIIILDQFTKYLIANSLSLGDSIPVIKNIFHITLIHNTGAAFGILKDSNILLSSVSIAVTLFIFYYIKTQKKIEKIHMVLLGFILGGTLGNLIDRLFMGYVVDFLDFRIWPVFNVADSFITVGVLALVLVMWKK
ncbi:signal peptidase II [Candidatus Woesearchaeota archaeon]|nr:signal peptidase II [Candidatus Woesearchaeota archaeon]